MDKQLLIIDNDSVELRNLRKVLAGEGFGIITATDMETAFKIYKKIEISFILSDSSIFNYLSLDIGAEHKKDKIE